METVSYIIAALLAANTAIVGLAAKLLFDRLDKQDESIAKCHQRIDGHIDNHFGLEFRKQ